MVTVFRDELVEDGYYRFPNSRNVFRVRCKYWAFNWMEIRYVASGRLVTRHDVAPAQSFVLVSRDSIVTAIAESIVRAMR
jgi:hypothetical protein